MLRYGPGDWNALHQDVYGEAAFPFQIVTILDRPDEDFEGGEFVLLERPRAQSRAQVCRLRRGAFLVAVTVTRRRWRLVGADGRPYLAAEPGRLGGNRSTRIYGRLECPGRCG